MTVTIGRRELLVALGGAAVSWPVLASAQQGSPIKRVGFLTLLSLKDEEGVLAAFLGGLRSHGLVEGQNLKLDYRSSEGDVKRLTPLAQELIALRPDVLVGGEPSPAKVLKSIAPTLPIVCPQLTDAQLSDLVASYARPGGTVTGLAETVEGLTGKLIELVQEFVPGAVRVGFLQTQQAHPCSSLHIALGKPHEIAASYFSPKRRRRRMTSLQH
jgi:ABC-type uncharacterized transport system substrate-binding protein